MFVPQLPGEGSVTSNTGDVAAFLISVVLCTLSAKRPGVKLHGIFQLKGLDRFGTSAKEEWKETIHGLQ